MVGTEIVKATNDIHAGFTNTTVYTRATRTAKARLFLFLVLPATVI
jgi:hypothetical protein